MGNGSKEDGVMRITAKDLIIAGWHCGWKILTSQKYAKRWAFRHNPEHEGLTFHEAVRAYKGGMRDRV